MFRALTKHRFGRSVGIRSVMGNHESGSPPPQKPSTSKSRSEKITIDQAELRARLTPIQFAVTQQKATERPYTGEYTDHSERGEYLCVVCESDLFTSDAKFDSGCGWPAFTAPTTGQAIDCVDDFSLNMIRTEVNCSKCGSHLGHVFDDGPLPARTRYCVNSASLKFVEKKPKNDE